MDADERRRRRGAGARLPAVVATVALLLLALAAGPLARADGPTLFPSGNERLGFGVTTDVAHFDLTPLHAGWYVNWGAAERLAHPAGLDFAQIVRVGARISPDLDTLGRIARANPGSLWLVGNEPDCIWQDNVTPERYAEQYHAVYTALRAADPTCRVAIGGVVQATPLRLEWLDRVWSHYQQTYGVEMPVDVWNVHGFILQELRYSWGCDIPPGIDATQGMLYGVDDHDDMEIFRRQIIAFRQWMAGKGQRDKPLIVSEYGILFHEGLGYTYERAHAFMLATFDFFLHGTDTQLGYPADGNRLVQRWAWYSLDDTSFEQQQYMTWSALYDPFPPYAIRQMGRDFGAYAGALVTPYVDLQPARLDILPAQTPTNGQPVTLTLQVTVRNAGNTASQGPVAVVWREGDVDLGTSQIAAAPSRYAGERLAVFTTTSVMSGPKTIVAHVNPAGNVPEWDLTNNVISATLAARWPRLYLARMERGDQATSARLHLPLLLRFHP